jgi:hypothetical protein
VIWLSKRNADASITTEHVESDIRKHFTKQDIPLSAINVVVSRPDSKNSVSVAARIACPTHEIAHRGAEALKNPAAGIITGVKSKPMVQTGMVASVGL